MYSWELGSLVGEDTVIISKLSDAALVSLLDQVWRVFLTFFSWTVSL